MQGMDPAKMDVELALELLSLPKMLGDGVMVGLGRFGPYVYRGKVNASVPKRYDYRTLTLEEAIQLLNSKEKRASGDTKSPASKFSKATETSTPVATSTPAKKRASRPKKAPTGEEDSQPATTPRRIRRKVEAALSDELGVPTASKPRAQRKKAPQAPARNGGELEVEKESPVEQG